MKSRINRILDNLEKTIGIFGVSLFGMISYLFVNIEKLSFGKTCVLIGGMLLVIVIIITLCVVYRNYLNKIKE